MNPKHEFCIFNMDTQRSILSPDGLISLRASHLHPEGPISGLSAAVMLRLQVFQGHGHPAVLPLRPDQLLGVVHDDRDAAEAPHLHTAAWPLGLRFYHFMACGHRRLRGSATWRHVEVSLNSTAVRFMWCHGIFPNQNVKNSRDIEAVNLPTSDFGGSEKESVMSSEDSRRDVYPSQEVNVSKPRIWILPSLHPD